MAWNHFQDAFCLGVAELCLYPEYQPVGCIESLTGIPSSLSVARGGSLSECVLLTGEHPYQYHECIRSMEMTKPSLGPSIIDQRMPLAKASV